MQRLLIDLFLFGVAVQFFLAGLGVFGADHPGRPAAASTFDAHRTLGNLLLVLALAITATSVAAKQQVRSSGFLLVMMGLQSVWTQAGSGTPAVGALHVLGGFVIAIVAFAMRRVGHGASSGDRRDPTNVRG